MSVESPIRETYLSAYAPIVLDNRVILAFNQQGPYKGTWNLPGGGVEFGEDPNDAIRREIWEELGVSVEDHRLIGTHTCRTIFERAPSLWIDFYHIALLFDVTLERMPSETIVSPDPKERVAWHHFDSLAEIPLAPCARHCLAPYLVASR